MNDAIWIAIYQRAGDRAHVLTAYTDIAEAKRACVNAALEYGLRDHVLDLRPKDAILVCQLQACIILRRATCPEWSLHVKSRSYGDL